MAARKLQLHEDHGIGSGNGVLSMAQVVLQSLALISAELTPPRAPGALITQREDEVAEGWDGKPGALIRQVGGGSNHCEGSLDGGNSDTLLNSLFMYSNLTNLMQ